MLLRALDQLAQDIQQSFLLKRCALHGLILNAIGHEVLKDVTLVVFQIGFKHFFVKEDLQYKV